MPKKLWFKNKSYGWGWTPANWKGWLVLDVYLGFFFLIFRRVEIISNSGKNLLYEIFIPLTILTAIFLVICYKTGEKPEWRWRKEK